MKKLFLGSFVLLGIFFLNCFTVEAEIGLYPPKKFSVDKFTSPRGSYTWYKSWVLKRSLKTLTNSFQPELFEETIWIEYSYLAWKKPIRESGNCNIPEIEKWIFENFKYAAEVRYIEKKAPNFYIVVYRRNKQRMNIPKISGYPPIYIGNISRINIPIRDIFLLNPALIYNPSELEEIFIPYSFFADNFIYEHPKIIGRGDDPMIIKFKECGILIEFRKRKYYFNHRRY